MAKLEKPELLAELKRLADELGETPRITDMRQQGEYSPDSYYRRFGSWNDALRAADLTVNHNRKANKNGKEDLLDAIRELAQDGVPPTMKEMKENGRYSYGTYYNHFDSYNQAVREAGFEPNWSTEKIEKECEVCGATMRVKRSYSNRRFCGMECFAEHRQGNYTGEDHWNYTERVERECEICSEIVSVTPWYDDQYDRVFCSRDCQGEWSGKQWLGENNPRYSEGHTKYGQGFDEEKKERVREKYDRKCQNCGMDESKSKELWGERLNIHHVTVAQLFDDDEKRNAVRNLVPLCNKCHPKWEGIPVKPQLMDGG